MYWLVAGMAFIWATGVMVGFVSQGAQAGVTTTLSAGISASDTTIPITSGDGFSDNGLMLIDSEWISYDDIETPCATGAFAACAVNAERGRVNTSGVSHASAAIVYDELAGSGNAGLGVSLQTVITNFGETTNPIQLAGNLMGVLWGIMTWDFPMFDGDFAMLRVLGFLLIFPLVIVIGLEMLRTLAGIL